MGHKARDEAYRLRTPGGGGVRVGDNHKVEDDVADMWGWLISETKWRESGAARLVVGWLVGPPWKRKQAARENMPRGEPD